MNGCPVCEWDLEEGQRVSLPPLGMHTCEVCGFTYCLERVIAVYEGLAVRGGVITHIFVSENDLKCPECNNHINQINIPCGGNGIPVYIEGVAVEVER